MGITLRTGMDMKTGDIQEQLKQKLTALIADEWLSYYQYWTAYNMSRGPGKFDIDPELEEHAEDERRHADMLMLRLNQLGGIPVQDPTDWVRASHGFQHIDCTKPSRILDIVIDAERTAIDGYADLLDISAGEDDVTHKIATEILQDEEEHLYDLLRLKESI